MTQLINLNRLDKLTRREREVLSLLTEGYSNKEIARRVGRVEVTIKERLKKVYRKLNVKNRVQATRIVFELAWAVNVPDYIKLADALKLAIWKDDNEHQSKP